MPNETDPLYDLRDLMSIFSEGKFNFSLPDEPMSARRSNDYAILTNRLFAIRSTGSWGSGQEWMTVSLAMPFLMILYLFVIYMAYCLFCTNKASTEQIAAALHEESVPNDVSSSEPRTPPPSYSILISNGDSLVTPPSYRMLFPLESLSTDSFEDLSHLTFASNLLVDLKYTDNGSIHNQLFSPLTDTRIAIDHENGSIQKTTISYRMDMDRLTVTTVEKAFSVRSAILAKNVWISQKRKSEQRTGETNFAPAAGPSSLGQTEASSQVQQESSTELQSVSSQQNQPEPIIQV